MPTVPLTDLYSTAEAYIRARGGEVRLRSGVESYRAEPKASQLSVPEDEASFDFVVLAASFDVLPRLLPRLRPLSRCERV